MEFHYNSLHLFLVMFHIVLMNIRVCCVFRDLCFCIWYNIFKVVANSNLSQDAPVTTIWSHYGAILRYTQRSQGRNHFRSAEPHTGQGTNQMPASSALPCCVSIADETVTLK
jgi:hypothetical protein